MTKLLLKCARYVNCYSELAFGVRPRSLEEIGIKSLLSGRAQARFRLR